MSDSKLVNLKTRYKQEADERARISQKWVILFSIASTEDIKPWEVVSFVYDKSSGSSLEQEVFHIQRTAKILAAIDGTSVDKSFHTPQDLINWNRKAIVAKIEVERSLENKPEIISRGEKALEIINILFPEYLLNE